MIFDGGRKGYTTQFMWLCRQCGEPLFWHFAALPGRSEANLTKHIMLKCPKCGAAQDYYTGKAEQIKMISGD